MQGIVNPNYTPGIYLPRSGVLLPLSWDRSLGSTARMCMHPCLAYPALLPRGAAGKLLPGVNTHTPCTCVFKSRIELCSSDLFTYSTGGRSLFRWNILGTGEICGLFIDEHGKKPPKTTQGFCLFFLSHFMAVYHANAYLEGAQPKQTQTSVWKAMFIFLR